MSGFIQTLTSLTVLPSQYGFPTAPLVLGSSTGFVTVHLFNGTTYPLVGSANLHLGPIDGITFGPADSLWIGSAGVLKVLLPPYVFPLWESAPYGGAFGQQTSFLITPAAAMFLNAAPHAIVVHGVL